MEDCQLRSGEGQTRHMYLVILAPSLLVSQMQQGRVCEWARTTLTTIGQACRAALRQALGETISWVIERVTTLGGDEGRIMAGLALA